MPQIIYKTSSFGRRDYVVDLLNSAGISFEMINSGGKRGKFAFQVADSEMEKGTALIDKNLSKITSAGGPNLKPLAWGLAFALGLAVLMTYLWK